MDVKLDVSLQSGCKIVTTLKVLLLRALGEQIKERKMIVTADENAWMPEQMNFKEPFFLSKTLS